MYKKLNESEINLVLNKIRTRYKKIIKDFKKTNSVLEAFNDRYMRILKNKMDLSIFLLAEIEAVEELYKSEEEKYRERIKELKRKQQKKPTFADKIYEENKKRIEKYPKTILHQDADDELERLVGAVRILITKYWPVITYIFKNDFNTPLKQIFNNYYDKIISNFDYKEDVPMAKSYIFALSRIPKDNNKINYEHHYILKESAFLLNDILESFNKMIKDNSLLPNNDVLNFNKYTNDKWIIQNFNGLTPEKAFEKIIEYLTNVIMDFRIRDIKRSRDY